MPKEPQRRIGINQRFDKPCKVYDVNKPIGERMIGEFTTMAEAARFLGVERSIVSNAIARKGRILKNKLGIIACVR